MTAIPECTDSPGTKVPFTPEEREQVKARLKARTIAWRHMPVLRLNSIGKRAEVKLPKESRLPLSVDIVKQFIFNITLGNNVALPNWCQVSKINNVSCHVILAIDEVSLADIQDNPDLFHEACRLLKDGVEMSCAWSEGVGLSQALAFVPTPAKLRSRLKQGLGSFSQAIKEGYIHGVVELSDLDRKITPSVSDDNVKSEEVTTDKQTPTKDTNGNLAETSKASIPNQLAKNGGCSKVQLLLSPAQLVAEGYPLPGLGQAGFRFTKDVYSPVSDSSPMFSIDCEWCLCIDGSSGLSRVAIVDDKLQTVYHTFVKPKLPILDYLTRFSGITKQLLKNVKKTPDDVQEDIRELLPPDAILVGQSLNSDLKALKLYHPYVIDTSIIYNLTGRRSLKTKLQLLTDAFMRKSIQCSASGHNPIEDALAAMELVLLKLKMGIEYGDVILSGHSNWMVLPRHKIRDILLAQENEDIAEAELEEEEDGETNSTDEDEEKEIVIKEDGNKKPKVKKETVDHKAAIKRKASEMENPKKVKLYDENTRFFMKFALMMHVHNLTATLIVTDKSVADTYRPAVTQPNQRVVKRKLSDIEKPLVDPVNIQTVDFSEIVARVGDSIKSTRTTIVHTSIDAVDKKTREEQLKQIDNLIGSIYSLIPLKGMLTVVIGGRKSPQENGACFVKIHKPYIT